MGILKTQDVHLKYDISTPTIISVYESESKA